MWKVACLVVMEGCMVSGCGSVYINSAYEQTVENIESNQPK